MGVVLISFFGVFFACIGFLIFLEKGLCCDLVLSVELGWAYDLVC